MWYRKLISLAGRENEGTGVVGVCTKRWERCCMTDLSGRVGKRRGPGLLGVSSKRRDTHRQAREMREAGRQIGEGGEDGRKEAVPALL